MKNIFLDVNLQIKIYLFFILILIGSNSLGGLIGDGREYYCMLINISQFHQPYATDESLKAYNIYSSNTSPSFFTSSYFIDNFPMFTVEGKIDFPHFWFYSLLAAPFAIILKFLSLDIGYSFTLLHLALFFLVLYISNKYYKNIGMLASLLIILSSPAIWYINKAHTEFFTVTLSILAIIYFMQRKLVISSLLFAVLSTQNPPFAIISIIIGFYAIYTEKQKLLGKKNLSLILLTIVFLSLHPVYYFLRLGVITPQLLTGVTSDTPSLHKMLLWFLDIDIGLFANWFFGSLIVLIVLISNIKNITFKNLNFNYFFVFISFVIFSYSQSKTLNINHGAIVSMSRYGLWYIAFFFPLIYFVFLKFKTKKLTFTLLGMATFLLVLINLYYNNPKNLDGVVNQTLFAKTLYKYFPKIYEPEPEIFIEKIIKQEISYTSFEPWAVSNDSSNKIIVLKKNFLLLDKCNLPEIVNSKYNLELDVFIKALDHFTKYPKDEFFYVYFKSEDLLKSMKNPKKDIVKIIYSSDDLRMAEANSTLKNGWNNAEDWGVWSKDNIATIEIKDINTNDKKFHLSFIATSWLVDRNITIKINGKFYANFLVAKDIRKQYSGGCNDINFKQNNTMLVEFIVPDYDKSPKKLAISEDNRTLGIGLSSIKVFSHTEQIGHTNPEKNR